MADLQGYQRFVVGKVSPQTRKSKDTMLTAAALGLTGEAGEFADAIKKVLFHAHPMTRELRDKLVLEIGDVLFYAALAAEALDIDLDDAFAKNITKLNERYPQGFDPTISRQRYENIEQRLVNAGVSLEEQEVIRQRLQADQDAVLAQLKRGAQPPTEGGDLAPVRFTTTVTSEVGPEALGIGSPERQADLTFPHGYAVKPSTKTVPYIGGVHMKPDEAELPPGPPNPPRGKSNEVG